MLYRLYLFWSFTIYLSFVSEIRSCFMWRLRAFAASPVPCGTYNQDLTARQTHFVTSTTNWTKLMYTPRADSYNTNAICGHKNVCRAALLVNRNRNRNPSWQLQIVIFWVESECLSLYQFIFPITFQLTLIANLASSSSWACHYSGRILFKLCSITRLNG